MHAVAHPPAYRWDIFCKVIDNLGDIGVCWRLAANLALRAQQVRLWVDQPDALAWLAPEGAPGVQVRRWTTPFPAAQLDPGDVLVEAFGCEIAPEFVAAYARSLESGASKCHWINLEYLSAEAYVARCHGLQSPIQSGPAKGLSKHFFYPGFTTGSGGLLREPDLRARQSAFHRERWLAQQGIQWRGENILSLFCYEPAALPKLLQTLANGPQRSLLLVTEGRAAAAVRTCLAGLASLGTDWNAQRWLDLHFLPALAQTEFDHLLWSCDLNFVRGEDSLVRALWAGQALVWQAYPQQDGAHHTKLDAWLDWLQAPASLRAFHDAWNGAAATAQQALPAMEAALWRRTIERARNRLYEQGDLASQLLQFVSKTN